MCSPLAIGLGMQGASTLLNARANKKIMERQGALSDAERARQDAFHEEAAGTLDETMGKFDRGSQDANTEQAAARREAVLSDAVGSAPAAGDLPGEGDAPEVVRSTIARRMADVLSQGRERIKAQAKLGAFGENQFGNRVALTRSGQKIGQAGDFARGSSGVLDHELAGAHRAGQGSRQLADLFRLGGSGLALYSMMGPDAGPTQPFNMSMPGGYTGQVPGIR